MEEDLQVEELEELEVDGPFVRLVARFRGLFLSLLWHGFVACKGWRDSWSHVGQGGLDGREFARAPMRW